MKPRHLTFFAAVFLSLGCMHGGQRDRAFTPDWARQCAKDAELEARKAYIRGEGDIVLVDRDGFFRTALVPDEEGRPRLNMGRDSGWGWHVRFRNGSPDVKVKYSIGWRGARPKKDK